MKIAIIGAGFAGLSSAKVLGSLGHEITVFEKAPDVGGVWSSTRRYPGLTTQNNKQTYHLSELKMPRRYPQWLASEQVQEYLETYVERFGLGGCLRLGTEITKVTPTTDEDGWLVTANGETEQFDHVVVANGIFSTPVIPDYEGVAELEAAGGRLISTSDLRSLDEVAGRHVLMVGYGKSSCDVAAAVAEVAESTDLIARDLLWKVPRKVAGILNYKYLLLTRFGEGLFPYQKLTGVEKLLHANNSRIAHGLTESVGAVVTRQLGLEKLGLVPEKPFHTIAKASVSLASEGFYEGVRDGSITVHRRRTITRFLEKNSKPYAELSDGTVLRADVVICGTGFRQEVPFFDDAIQQRLTDADGNFLLYRHILPLDVPNLTFAGYNSSFFSPLSAEMAAVWTGSYLAGAHTLPTADQMRASTTERIAWMEARTDGHHARGTNVVPFSLHNIDEVLDEAGLNLGKFTRALQWLAPVSPWSYRKVSRRLARRIASLEQPRAD
ncbi:NAD(P)/FAD-dependent oxidoreductase [Gordonia sp. zg691]|uniref:flavin-containing monooxygenase n=1 Tax=Gordonia jinghuaiqii TaxID=2758710 RepID=UPI00166257AD|nr:NAD(P)/FAD-dependent oxidoreductase [Gordonia jinghuaiqii]MBD0863088.1 NAD(P)/FAD-dependent oxidoreductase [Gordonia jinghuaiqii]